MNSTAAKRISILQLSFGTFIYSRISHYDESLEELRKNAGPIPDLSNEIQVHHVLKWLRKWKCRNLEIRHEETSIESIKHWFAARKDLLEELPDQIDYYNARHLVELDSLFEGLSESHATPKKRIGATAAAKILYLIKPNALPPWDEFIRTTLHHNGSGISYCAFVDNCRYIIKDIKEQCLRAKVTLADVVQHGRQPEVSSVKAIDEYYWTTITSKMRLPSDEEIEVWRKVLFKEE
jgi:hypothetical protein